MKKILLVLVLNIAFQAQAGVDVIGYITSVHLKGSALNFSFSNRTADTYCKIGWASTSFTVPSQHKDFPYYYGLITSASANKQKVRIANISKFNGSGMCDITQTGYGIVVYPKE
jgi:hypothetical protein